MATKLKHPCETTNTPCAWELLYNKLRAKVTKQKQLVCPACGSDKITVDNREQDLLFRGALKENSALYLDATCDKCGNDLIVTYHAVIASTVVKQVIGINGAGE